MSSKWFDKRLFDIEKLTITLLIPTPLDIAAGLVLEDPFLKIQKEDPKLIKFKVGLGGETLLNENINNVHSVELYYLPSAPAVSELDLLKKAGTRFGILFQNNSSPRYKGMASNCRIVEKPPLAVGVKGFGTLVWKILMADYIEIYLGSI
ncbi:hypothetical protein [Leptospira noguchii]|uniref:hypothetical protein n=1 Tax=Leptospira noguchii TaxID=28182 RepID=UPI0007747B4C|nr:hypothetical protein [Leptospira noguchii]